MPSDLKKTMKNLTEGDNSETFGVTISPDKTHLLILPLSALFQNAAEGNNIEAAQNIASVCKPLNIDSSSRLLISKEHVSQLNLDQDDNDLVAIGSYNHIAIWPKKTWEQTQQTQRLEQTRAALEGLEPNS